MHRSAQARKKNEDVGGETVIEMEALLSNKAHASPMSKECEVVVLFDEEHNSASADTRRIHGADDQEHSGGAKKWHVQNGASVSEPPRVLLIGVLLLSLGCMVAVVCLLPPLKEVDEGDKFLWRPRSASEFELDKRVLVRYRDEHSWQLLVGFSVIYIILQTFCVPASGTSMNVLAGCIFSETLPSGEYLVALPMAVLCVSFGAIMCYLISHVSLRELVTRNFPSKVQWLRLRMTDLSPLNMVLFFVSLRVSPVVPAYLLNLIAPLTPLPLLYFWVATIIGCTPHAVVTVTAGATLSRLRPGEDVLRNNAGLLFFLLVLSVCVALIPSGIKRCGPKSMAAAHASSLPVTIPRA